MSGIFIQVWFTSLFKIAPCSFVSNTHKETTLVPRPGCSTCLPIPVSPCHIRESCAIKQQVRPSPLTNSPSFPGTNALTLSVRVFMCSGVQVWYTLPLIAASCHLLSYTHNEMALVPRPDCSPCLPIPLSPCHIRESCTIKQQVCPSPLTNSPSFLRTCALAFSARVFMCSGIQVWFTLHSKSCFFVPHTHYETALVPRPGCSPCLSIPVSPCHMDKSCAFHQSVRPSPLSNSPSFLRTCALTKDF